jgi:Spy/CpxP family protein refolding chaperone
MKSLKAILSAIAFAVAFSAPMQAQEKKGAMTAEQQIERIEAAVGSLTKAQKDKITAIVSKTAESMKEIPKEERKEKGGALQKKSREDIRAVLTPEQQAKFDAMPQGGGGKKKN